MSRADDGWVIAKEVALEEGLASALPLYLQAADRFVAEGRADDGLSRLAELLWPQDKKALSRKRGEALGPFRTAVAEKFAELARPLRANPSLVSMLNQLASEFGGVPGVRLANAEKLRAAARRGEALEEYRRYVREVPDDAGALAALSELLVELHQDREALDLLQRALEALSRAGDEAALVEAARAFIERVPGACGEVLALVSKCSGAQAADKLIALAGAQTAPQRRPVSDLEKEARAGDLGAIAQLARQKAVERSAKLSAAGARAAGLPSGAEPVPAVRTTGTSRWRGPRVKPGVTSAALAEFARAKGRELYGAGNASGASAAFERALKAEASVEAQQALMRCYHELDRKADAAEIGLQLVDAQVAAGDVRAAYDTLTWLSTATGEPHVWDRRAEIAAALGEELSKGAG